MNQHNGAPIHLILFVIACVFLALAAFPVNYPTYDTYRVRFGWFGMFLWAISTFF
jgi:hypothetical protein